MRKLLDYVRPYTGKVVFLLIIKILGTIAELLLPTILSFMIDEIAPQKDIPLVFIWGGIMLVVSLFVMWSNVYPNRVAGKVSTDITQTLRQDLFERTIYLRKADVDRLSLSSLNTRLTSDTYNIHNMFNFMLRAGLKAPLLLIGGVIMTAIQDPILTLILLVLVPFLMIFFLSIFKKGVPMFRDLQIAIDTMVRVVRENAQGIRVIKALSKVEYEKEHFDEINKEVNATDIKAGITMAISNPVVGLFFNIGLVAVVFVGAFRVNVGTCTPATITAFILYFSMILSGTMMINRMFIMYSRAVASMDRISEVLYTPSEFTEKEENTHLKKATVKDKNEVKDTPHIVFDDVSFSYNSPKNQLENISFELNHGETLGIIGGTGSGKSTLIKLILGFYKTTKGLIEIDGKSINSYHLIDLRNMIGAILQTDTLFNQSIRDNLTFGRDISDEQLQQAIKMAQAEEFVSEKEEGLDYMLNARGSNLSGGQKQRLYIARALASQPQILILDDSSSALDYRTDANLRKDINTYYKDTTKIIVAQRVSSVLNANKIIVLDKGKVIGYGTHEELLSTCSVYQEISNSQLGGAVDE